MLGGASTHLVAKGLHTLATKAGFVLGPVGWVPAFTGVLGGAVLGGVGGAELDDRLNQNLLKCYDALQYHLKEQSRKETA